MKQKRNDVIIKELSELIMVPSHLGGMGRECEHFVSALADRVATKRQLPFSEVINWIMRKISFVLIRSSCLCLRGSKGKKKDAVEIDTGDISVSNFTARMLEDI